MNAEEIRRKLDELGNTVRKLAKNRLSGGNLKGDFASWYNGAALINGAGVAAQAAAIPAMQEGRECPLDNLNDFDDCLMGAQNFGDLAQDTETPVQLYYDPLVLDLNHDGKINTVSMENSDAFFDLNGDQFAEKVAWVTGGDGILTYDKDEDNLIDGIDEVFGNNQLDGLTELAQYDTDNNGVIDANDEIYQKLKIWVDSNCDGSSNDTELYTLDELGITSISLKKEEYILEENDTRTNGVSNFTQNGNTHLVGNVELSSDTSRSKYTGEIDYNIASLFLPMLRGYGNVMFSSDAYSLDINVLEKALDCYLSLDYALNNFDSFMAAWTGLDKIHEQNGITRTELNSSDKLWMIEAFMGFKDTWLTEIAVGELKNGKRSFMIPADASINPRGIAIIVYVDEEWLAANPGATVMGASEQSYKVAFIEAFYNDLRNKYQALFLIQSHFVEAFQGVIYDLQYETFEVEDRTLFTQSFASFIDKLITEGPASLYIDLSVTQTLMSLAKAIAPFQDSFGDVSALIEQTDFNDAQKALFI